MFQSTVAEFLTSKNTHKQAPFFPVYIKTFQATVG